MTNNENKKLSRKRKRRIERIIEIDDKLKTFLIKKKQRRKRKIKIKILIKLKN